ncbi:AlbA family DNA-binding domain-containing protein [Neolewinella antarctica]|uniref:Schlafen AlbA-2 domain-containing protein n=1 Tax=Neolewinella antarctica TaxID=442734 RepID=A0ABX0XEY0_9BACT|nr:ATP-binding protein [Neolewinella antarctica]NJC27878.1 hypothetical protein [Neolewinella antarctica]
MVALWGVDGAWVGGFVWGGAGFWAGGGLTGGVVALQIPIIQNEGHKINTVAYCDYVIDGVSCNKKIVTCENIIDKKYYTMFERRDAFDGEEKLLKLISEDHFNDAKSKRIAPNKLQETFVAFANSDGGDLYIGIEDEKVETERLIDFVNEEEANEIIHHLLEGTDPSVENMEIEFIDFKSKGLVLHIIIPKSPAVHYCANGDCYIRVNARKSKIKGDRITQLAYSKGFYKYEQIAIKGAELNDYLKSENVLSYKNRIGTKLDTGVFFKKTEITC